MPKLAFELNNAQRQYLGLIPVEVHWELVELAGSYVYFDGHIIRKKINVSPMGYYECELNELTAENRTLLIPKKETAKPKKLNYTATLSFRPFGVYFKYSSDYVCIANYTTQNTFYHQMHQQHRLDDLKLWLAEWIRTSTAQDLMEITAFKQAKRKHQKMIAGDFFAFKIGRRQWGFGRILFNLSVLKKDATFQKIKHYGLNNLMGKSLIIQVYHHIQDNKDVELNRLAESQRMPAQAIMDNQFYYSEHLIIGHLPLQDQDFEDLLISYHPSISGQDQDTVYLQYGLIYKEMDKVEHQRLIQHWIGNAFIPAHQYFRNEAVGFDIYTECLKQSVAAGSNLAFWTSSLARQSYDLRNPYLSEIKDEVLSAFGLDANLSYAENLKNFLLE